jgi:ATP-dependent DNA helicase PIF1
MSIELATDQKLAFDAVLENRCVFITGPAGTGKSVLIKELATYYRNKGLNIYLCSSTGVSAYLIGGMTVHAFIKAIQMGMIELERDAVIVIDEISMLGRTVFEELDMRLQAYYRKKGMPSNGYFGGHHMILVGDFAQLPPVNDSFCFTSPLWEYVDKEVELTIIKRQTEREFVEFLLRVRSGRLSMADRRRIHNYQSRPLRAESIQLYMTNEKARQYNNRKLLECSRQSKEKIHIFPAETVNKGTFLDREVQDFMTAQKARFYDELSICVGSKVMLTCNLNVGEGWVNGSLCEVEEIKEDGIVLSRMMEEVKVTIMIEKETYTRSKQVVTSSAPCNYVVGRKMCGKRECRDHAEIIYTDRDATDNDISNIADLQNTLIISQYPLLLAWAMTIHKAQGSTLDCATVHLSAMRYTPSLFYVAISRCKTEDGLCIRSEGPIQYDQICPEETILQRVFKIQERECGLCTEMYIGPYKFCSDCSSAPGGYSIKCFKDFTEKPTEEMIKYIEFALSNKGYNNGRKWKKFVEYLEKEYRIKA